MWNGGSWSQVSYLSAGWHQSDQGPRGTVMVPWRTEWSTKVTVNSSNVGQRNTHFTSGPDPLKTNLWGLACLGPLWLFWGGDWLSQSVVFPQGCWLWKRGAGSPAGVQLLWCEQSLEITPWSGGFYLQLSLERRERVWAGVCGFIYPEEWPLLLDNPPPCLVGHVLHIPHICCSTSSSLMS